MELFKSPVINRTDLFQSHKVARSGTALFRNIMSKDTAYSKLSRGTKNIDALIDDRRAMINILERKQKKTRLGGKYNNRISLLTAEKDALQAEKDKHKKDIEDLIRFTTAYAGKTIPADIVTSFVGGRTPLPYRLTSPEIIQEANQIRIPELSTQPITIPTSSGLALPAPVGGEAGGPLPMVSSGGPLPFEPPMTQAPVENQTGQGIGDVDSGALTEEQAKAEEPGVYGVSELSDNPIIRGEPEKNYRPRIEAMKDKLMEEYYKKNPRKYGFVSSDTEPERPPRRKKKEPKPEEVVIKSQELSESDTEPDLKEILKDVDVSLRTKNKIETLPLDEVLPELEELKQNGDITPKQYSLILDSKTDSSDYLSEKLKKVNAKEIEKYLKNYRIPFKSRPEFTSKFPKGNYVNYLNGLIKEDPEFRKYHNVVKKK